MTRRGFPPRTARRGLSVVELTAAAALLVGAGVMLVQGLAAGAQQLDESRRRQRAAELADEALQRLWLAEWSELDRAAEQLEAELQASAPQHALDLTLGPMADDARQATAEVRWTNVAGDSSQLRLDAWRHRPSGGAEEVSR